MSTSAKSRQPTPRSALLGIALPPTEPAPSDAARHLVGIAYQPSLVPEAPLSLLRRKLELA